MTLTADSSSPAPPAGPQRYAQMIYASLASGAGRGGWQIKETRGSLSQAERDAIVARILTSFDLDPRLPDFPTEAQIAERPDRLSYALLGDIGVYWHTTDAGRDATGRPGNVFAHIVVDRAQADEITAAPIDLWGSALWLRPYGPQAVSAASLPDSVVPQSNPRMSTAASIRFLMAKLARQGLFRVLLDAVDDALVGGRPVVLLTTSHDDSAAWIAAVSHFLPLPTTHRFAWTTHDTASYAVIDIERGVHLIAVPAHTVTDDAHFPNAVVIDDAEQPELGAAGSTHRLAAAEVPATPLSTLIEGVLESEELAASVLELRDEIVTAFAPTELSPVWPLAAAISRTPELSEFHDEALTVVAHEAPANAAEHEIVADVVHRAFADHPITASETLVRLNAAIRRGAGVDVAADRLLREALADLAWINTCDVDTVPALRTVNAAPHRGALTAAIAQIHATSADNADGAAAATLRLTEIVHRLVKRDSDFPDLNAELLALWDLVDPTMLWDDTKRPTGWDFKLSTSVHAEFLRPRLLTVPIHTIAENMYPELWIWLFADDTSPEPSLTTPDNPSPADLSLYPQAVVSVLAYAQPGLSVEQRCTAVTDAIEFALADTSLSDGDCTALTSDLIALESPDPSRLLTWSRESPTRTSAMMLRDQVLYQHPGIALLTEVAHTPPGDDPAHAALVAAARLRGWYHQPDLLSAASQEEFLGEVRACLSDPRPWDYLLAEDLSETLYAGLLIGQSASRPWAVQNGQGAARLTVMPAPHSERLVNLLLEFVRRGLLSMRWVAARSFLTRLDFVRLAPTIADTTPADNSILWTDQLLTSAIRGGLYRSPTSDDEVRDLAWPHVSRCTAAEAQRFFAEFAKYVRPWLHDVEARTPESTARRIGNPFN